MERLGGMSFVRSRAAAAIMVDMVDMVGAGAVGRHTTASRRAADIGHSAPVRRSAIASDPGQNKPVAAGGVSAVGVTVWGELGGAHRVG